MRLHPRSASSSAPPGEMQMSYFEFQRWVLGLVETCLAYVFWKGRPLPPNTSSTAWMTRRRESTADSLKRAQLETTNDWSWLQEERALLDKIVGTSEREARNVFQTGEDVQGSA